MAKNNYKRLKKAFNDGNEKAMFKSFKAMLADADVAIDAHNVYNGLRAIFEHSILNGEMSKHNVYMMIQNSIADTVPAPINHHSLGMIKPSQVRTLMKFHILSNPMNGAWKSTLMGVKYEPDYWNIPFRFDMRTIKMASETLFSDMVLVCDCGPDLMEEHFQTHVVTYRADLIMRLGKLGDRYGIYGICSSFTNSEVDADILVSAIDLAYGEREAKIARIRLDGGTFIDHREEPIEVRKVTQKFNLNMKDL